MPAKHSMLLVSSLGPLMAFLDVNDGTFSTKNSTGFATCSRDSKLCDDMPEAPLGEKPQNNEHTSFQHMLAN